ncbi:MAG: Rrf2 family transcriptional regulator [Alphaproteobacteria bacterium]
MADSQRFAVAVHMLMILAARKAAAPCHPMTSGEMAKSVNANPVVLRRVISALAQAGVVATRPGANGGVWLARKPADIALDCVRQAVDDNPVVCCRANVNSDCPVAQAAAGVIDGVARRVDGAIRASLASLTLADLTGQMACLAPPGKGETFSI